MSIPPASHSWTFIVNWMAVQRYRHPPADVLSGARDEQAGAAVEARARRPLVRGLRHRGRRHRGVIHLALLATTGTRHADYVNHTVAGIGRPTLCSEQVNRMLITTTLLGSHLSRDGAPG